MKQVDNLMQRAVSENVFPGGVLLVSRGDSILFEKAYGYANIFSKQKMTRDTVFDLASLTKPLATTLAVMKLIQNHMLYLDQDLGAVLPEFNGTDKQQVKIRHLLCHNSGLPDYRPYYKALNQLPVEERKISLQHLLLKEPLVYAIGKDVLYSDLGFMILQWIVENVSGKRLDLFLVQEIYNPLGLGNDSNPGPFFVDLASETGKKTKRKFAATELCPWRKILLDGAVHDENAYVMGGIAGHSGLFGTVDNVHMLLSELLAAFHGLSATRLLKKDLLEEFFRQQPGTGRALGFDMPSSQESSSGRYFSKKSIGHLGYTGTSFWMDPDCSIILILLTNRVHPSRDNLKIKDFRPTLHDAVMESLLMSG